MSVNVFGSSLKSPTNVVGRRGLPGIGFKYLDDEGNFDMNNKRLANIADPIDENDAVNKLYTDELVESVNIVTRAFVDKLVSDRATLIERQFVNLRVEMSSDVAKVNDTMYKKFSETLNKMSVSVDAKFKTLAEQLSNVESVLRVITSDIVINSSEIEHVKAYIENVKEDVSRMKGLYTTIEAMQSAVNNIEIQFNRLENRINDLVKGLIRDNIEPNN